MLAARHGTTSTHISSKIRTDRDRARDDRDGLDDGVAPLDQQLARVSAAVVAASGADGSPADAATDAGAGAVSARPAYDSEAELALSMASLGVEGDGVGVCRAQKRGDRLVRSAHSPPPLSTPPSDPSTAATTIARSTSGGTRSTSATSSSSGDEGLVPMKLLPFRHVTDYTQPEDRPLETIGVWVVETYARFTNVVFEFLRRRQFNQLQLHHLKRVKRLDSTRVSIIIHTVDPPPPFDLADVLSKDSAVAMLELAPYTRQVPASHGSTLQQVAAWSELWPVTYIPLRFGARAVLRTKGWPQAQIDWVHDQLAAIWRSAQAAADKGELPIACSVSPSWDTALHSETTWPVELVGSHDTRRSTGHPLSHAFRNLIGEVAALDRLGLRREGGPCAPPPPPPRSLSHTALPTMSASQEDKDKAAAPRPVVPALPYLLTSMTVFASHEPCLLCSMSLLHSRVRTIFYIAAAPHAGGCGSVYSTHEDERLNHHFDVWTVDPDDYPPLKMRTTELPGHVFVRTLEVDP